MGHFSQFWTQWWRKGPNDTFILVRSAIAAHNIQTQYRLSKELLQTVQNLGMPVGEGLRLRQAYADAAGQGTVVWRMNTEAKKDSSIHPTEHRCRGFDHVAPKRRLFALAKNEKRAETG
jgi:hypothetical protein